MPIVFSALTPHPPVLIPAVGKKNLAKLKKTQAAMQLLEQELYAAKPDCVLIISPHGQVLSNAFNINLSPKYLVSFDDFGDFSSQLEFKSDPLAVQQIRAGAEVNDKVPLTLSSQEKLDHGIGVPLYYLMPHLKEVPIIPIIYSSLDKTVHQQFGEFLHRQLHQLNKRFALVASGDLSHRLTEDAPGGYSPQGEKFDKKLLALIKSKNTAGVLSLDPALVEQAGECGLKSIIILLGILSDINYRPEILSYEGPFGVGYAVVNFKLV